PSGARYPQQGSPFHTKYTIQTIAHNAILVNGEGQKTKDENSGGELINYKSLPHIAYAAGDATKCYGNSLSKYIRHVLLIRPSLIIIIDEIESTKPIQIDWLMHSKEKFKINNQSFVSHRNDAYMNVQLISTTNFNITQDDSWSIDPKEGYPMVTEEPPAKQWHLKATNTSKSNTLKIAAIMSIGDDDEKPDIKITQEKKYHKITAQFPNQGKVNIKLNLLDMKKKYLADIIYEFSSSKKEQLIIPFK
ncbi:MAG: heparinase II/III family protein, partial [Candidatus Anstonellales archaeon]